jgi:AraC family transcriptional activator of tynA and feaB
MMETYSTANVRRGSKVAYWNDLHCRLLFPLEVKPANPADFDADLSMVGMAGTLFAKVGSAQASVERTAGHIKNLAEQRFTLLMPLKGRIQLSHYGRDVMLEEGDFALFDSRAPSRMSYVGVGANQTLAVTAPTSTLRAYLPLPESVCGMRMPGARGVGRLLPPMLRGLWTQAAEGIPGDLGFALVTSLLHVAAAAYAVEQRAEVDDSAVRSVRKAQIKRFIEANLRDPELSVGAIAESMGVSSRYVHRVFAGENESILAYILRRRLEECARQLNNPLWVGHTATKIAFEWGFGSTAHFSRAFKLHFGVTPNDHRKSGQH